MSSTLQLSYLTTTQPNIGGTNVKIVTTQKMTSFSYIIFPGDNANYGTEYSNSLVNRSVNVGGDDCTLIDEDNDGVYDQAWKQDENGAWKTTTDGEVWIYDQDPQGPYNDVERHRDNWEHAWISMQNVAP
jgi:hypothetical protein